MSPFWIFIVLVVGWGGIFTTIRLAHLWLEWRERRAHNKRSQPNR